MALHPFQTFRRNQKTLLAALTIMCMFIFILQFGKGDALDRLAGWFGAGRYRATTVAMVFGKKVTDQELDTLRRHRELAETIVTVMSARAHGTLLKDLRDPKSNILADFDDAQKATISLVVRQMEERRTSEQFSQFPEILGGRFLSPEMRKDQVFRDHDRLQNLEQSLRGKGDESKARVVRELMAVLEYEMWSRDRPASERLLFGGSLRVDDLLDFAMWKQQADKLGITLTQDDIRNEINREAFGHDPLDANAAQMVAQVQRMQQDYRQVPNPALTADDIYTALGDELRVYLAQCAVLGYPAGVRYYRYVGSDVNHVPATATPDEFWNFYQENRTTLRVEMMPIKVDAFLKDVPNPPATAESDLKDLYNTYKDYEYNPDRDQSAFKEPRRVAIEWVSSKPDSPRNQKLAQEQILSMIAATPGSYYPILALTTQAMEEYQRLQIRGQFSMPRLTEPSFALSFYRGDAKAPDIATAAGQAAGASITGAGMPSVVTSYVASVVTRNKDTVAAAVERETKRRIPVDATLVLAGTNPWTAAGLWWYADRAEQALPLDVVQKDVMERVRNDLARFYLIEGLKTVQTELEKLKGRPEDERKKEAEKYLAKAIKEFGLTHGTSEHPDDQYQIADDNGLKSLRESYRLHPPREDFQGKNFPSLFFDNAPAHMPERWPTDRSRFAFMPLWETAEEPFLYWKTEDKKAYVPSYEEARPKVVQAWKFQEARKLARKEAERIRDKVREHKSKGDGITWMREECAKVPACGEIFPVAGIARLVPVFTGAAAARQFEPYRVDEDKFHARPDFVAQLMRSLKDPGDVTITWNRPESIYYVTLATDIHKPTEKEFYDNYAGPHILGDNLWQYMESQRRREYHVAALEQLRTEAGAPDGKWDVADDMRKRIEGRSSSEE
jgi:hypothetical protein